MGHMVFGVISILAGLSGVFVWWDDFGRVLRGVLPLGLLVIGLVAVGAAQSVRRKRLSDVPELGAKRYGAGDALKTAAASFERQSAP